MTKEFNMEQRIYLDYAATTPIDESVLEVMILWMKDYFGNPSALYEEGRKAKRGIEHARRQIAGVLGADKNEIYFTGGGSEADNWAIKGLALSQRAKGKHIITSAIEHHAVLHTCSFLEKAGWEITRIKPERDGRIRAEAIENAIRKDTVLVSVMAANNEIGTIQPIAEIGQITREKNVLFHTDAVQAFCHMPIDVKAMKIDALSLSGHKIYGPKGIGALYLRKGIAVDALIHGGDQERKHRAGTENVSSIIGLGKAAESANEEMLLEISRTQLLRDRLIEGIMQSISGVSLTGDPVNRLPGNAHFLIDDVDGNALLMRLDMAGIAASAGSACTAGSVEPSHVLAALGIDMHHRTSLRLSIGKKTGEEDIHHAIIALKAIVDELRENVVRK